MVSTVGMKRARRAVKSSATLTAGMCPGPGAWQ